MFPVALTASRTFPKILIFFSLITAPLTIANPTKLIKSGYGEPCSKSQRCQSQSWLLCNPQNNICQCAKPEEMIYDLHKDKCVSLIGERCKYGFEEDPETTTSDENLTPRWYEKAECVHQAFCDPLQGVCVCPRGFYEDVRRNQCTPLKNHLEPCRNWFECNSDKLLTCIENQCQCVLPGDMTFDSGKDNCLIQVGKQCYSNPQSFDNKVDGVEILKFKLLRRADCVDESHCSNTSSICSCPVGFYIDLDTKQCLPVKDYGEACGNQAGGTEECDRDKTLTCLDGTCKCDPDISIYNENETYPTILKEKNGYLRRVTVTPGVCVGKVGAACKDFQANGAISTVANMYCMDKAVCTSGQCLCTEGFTETSDKRCGLGYEKPCSMISGCSDKFVCTEDSLKDQMRCTCPNPDYQLYDLESQKCRGVVGAPCNSEADLSCIKNTHCTNNTNNGAHRFRCECMKGYVESVNGTCEIEFGYPCRYEIDNTDYCDHLAGLKCRGKWQSANFTCSCPNEEQIYEAGTGKRRCSIPVGVRCSRTDQCVSNAKCEKGDVSEGLAGRCVCTQGFRLGDKFTCVSESEVGEVDSKGQGLRTEGFGLQTSGEPIERNVNSLLAMFRKSSN